MGKTEIKRQRKSISFMQYIALVLGCIAINLIGNSFSIILRIPMKFSAIGTLISAVVGGTLPSIITAVATSMFQSIYDSNAVFYGILNVITALYGTFWAERLFQKRSAKTLISVPILVTVIGITETVITWFLYDRTNWTLGIFDSFFMWIHENTNLSEFYSLLISNIVIEMIDKLITIIIATLVIWVLLSYSKNWFGHIGIWQKSLTFEEEKIIKHSKCKFFSIRTKIFLVITISGLLISSILIGISFVMFRDSTIDANIKLANSINEFTISIIDPEKVDDYIEHGRLQTDYVETEKKIYNFLTSNSDIKYIYVYKILPNGCQIVFDLAKDELGECNPGEIIPFEKSFENYLPELLEGKQIEPIIDDDSYGWLLTVYRPLYDINGNCKCYVAVDISMDLIFNYCSSFLIKFVSLMSIIFCLITAVSLWIIKHNIIYPINTIAYATGRFAYDNDEVSEDNVKFIKSMNIHTGDEIEQLYKSLLKTVDDSEKYLKDIKSKNDTIMRLQSSLITVLADMIESRDQCTGNHIRKTVAYVAIISDQMRKSGYYKEEFTDEFIENLMYAAPLHDIGKIHIPDNILNKNGKLSDQEFKKMQEHTEYGAKMIEKVIEIVPDSTYLQTAREVALFHHEKWDGTGYPCGISGVDIPLPARIMAVADVFDALTSKRSYKQPFSFEKAVSIIKEGNGTHFDPLVVKAFLQAVDRISIVAKEYAEEFEE